MQILQLLSILLLLLTACSTDEPFAVRSVNYADGEGWAQLALHPDKEVDVFYVYPTLYGGTGDRNMDITDDDMQSRVQSVIERQASVFTDDCNLYVPYYRQISMDLLSVDEASRAPFLAIAMRDVVDAFDDFVAHRNSGRPFVLAGHSQGSQMLIHLLKERFGDEALRQNLVAAYLIGYSVTTQDIEACPWIKIAEQADDLGVVVTYNTQTEGAVASPVLLPGALCVNPLNWKNTREYAPKELHKGAVFFDSNNNIDRVETSFTDTWINDKGALVVGLVDKDAYASDDFALGVLHRYDYSFFYKNLQENVGVRVNAFLQHRESLLSP